MKILLMMFLCLFSITARAVNFEFYPLNHESRFSRNEDQNLSATNPRNFAMAFSMAPWGVMLEASNQTHFVGQEYANFTGAHQEVLLWGRYEKFVTPIWAFLGAAGLGYSQDEVETRFGYDRERAQGERLLLGGLSGGTAIDLFKVIRLTAEMRVFVGGALDPATQADFILRSGVRF